MIWIFVSGECMCGPAVIVAEHITAFLAGGTLSCSERIPQWPAPHEALRGRSTRPQLLGGRGELWLVLAKREINVKNG